MTPANLPTPDWEKINGLIPAIVQDSVTRAVLMLGYMNKEALEKTATTGLVTFFSRTRGQLWTKGETSGHTLTVQEIRMDCDNDALLIFAKPNGPTCHTGAISCFDAHKAAQENEGPDLSLLLELENVIRTRQSTPQESSYTASLFAQGLPRIAQKVGEEGVETALAGALRADNLCEEAADLIFHLLVLLRANDKSLTDVLTVLQNRRK